MWNNTIHYRENNVTHPWELTDLTGRRIGVYTTFRKAERAASGVYDCPVCHDSGCENCPKVRAA